MGMISIPIGYNRLKLHETPDLCDLDLTVSNEAIANLGDLLPSLMGNRPRRHNGNLVNNQPLKQSDLVEVAPETAPSQPQLPPASSKTDSPNAISSDLIWEIFRKQEGGGLKQDIINLKASGKKDYTMRLVYLYLYARFKLGEDIVSRNDIYTFLDSVNPNLRDSNMSHYISQAQGISFDDSGTLRLTHEGRKKAEQYIEDVFNPDLGVVKEKRYQFDDSLGQIV